MRNDQDGGLQPTSSFNIPCSIFDIRFLMFGSGFSRQRSVGFRFQGDTGCSERTGNRC
jgi:hypothetical protein